MKAMILAAGLGTRLRPLTLEIPKPMVKVGDMPLIEWHIRRLKQAGITEIVINTAWLGHKLEEYLQHGQHLGVSIEWSHEQEPLETAGGIYKALPLLEDDPFVLINGDIWTDYPFERLTQKTEFDQLAHLVLVPNPIQHPQGDFILDTPPILDIHQGDSLVGLVKPMPVEVTQASILPNCYTFSGMSLLHPHVIAEHFTGGKGPLAPLLKLAMLKNAVTGEVWQGQWEDIGTLERLAKINELVAQSAK